jgi:DNA modification methylase
MLEYNKVYHMDNREGMSQLPDKCANLIIADPPYFEVKGAFDFVFKSFEEYLHFMEDQAQHYKRILADNGTLFVYGDAKNIAYVQVIFDKYFTLINNLVWHKKECQTLRNEIAALRSFAPVTERILMYSNEDREYGVKMDRERASVWDELVDYMRTEKVRSGLKGKQLDSLLGTQMAGHYFGYSQWSFPTKDHYATLQTTGFWQLPYEELKAKYEELKAKYEELRRPFKLLYMQSDVFHLSQESHITKNYDHETKKPEYLTRLLINTCSRPNDLVIVPFAGSGTECAMSLKEGRKFIGFETEEKHVQTARERCGKIANTPTLFQIAS